MTTTTNGHRSNSLLPPHNLEAERSVLGAVLLDERHLNTLLADEQLRPEHFYREQHGLVFAAMLHLHDQARKTDTQRDRCGLGALRAGPPDWATDEFARQSLLSLEPPQSGDRFDARARLQRAIALATRHAPRSGGCTRPHGTGVDCP
jgi:DnaB-like helicase N terminal domain